jgi:hypothetical protein
MFTSPPVAVDECALPATTQRTPPSFPVVAPTLILKLPLSPTDDFPVVIFRFPLLPSASPVESDKIPDEPLALAELLIDTEPLSDDMLVPLAMWTDPPNPFVAPPACNIIC